jgi:hypothetical protein
MEGTHHNDNEEFTFTSLAAATARVVDRLRSDKQQDEHSQGDSNAEGRSEKDEKQHRESVEYRLREWRAWERRISGKG